MKRILRIVPMKAVPKSRTYNHLAGWRQIAERRIYFRSKWEVDFAKYLQFLKEKNQIQEWEHEPQTFWFENIKRGVRSYLPDFKITRLDGSHYWIEVKGYMDAKSQTKIKRFKKYYPQEQLMVIDSKWFKNPNNLFVSNLIQTKEIPNVDRVE